MPFLQGKVAVVTGASYGVGRAISIGLAREGCDVVLAARTEKELQITRKRVESAGRRALAVVTDIGNPGSVRKLAEVTQQEFGRVDVLVNCAFGHIGEDEGKSLLDVSMEDLVQFGQTSVIGTWLVNQAFAPLLQKSKGRAIFIAADWAWPQWNIFLSTSVSAPADKRLGSEAFASAKASIPAFAYTMERMLGVPTTIIAPGIIASGKSEGGYFDLDDPLEEVSAEYGDLGIPLRDVVESVIFALKLHSVAKLIVLKPLAPEYDGLGIE